jgi:hypothetical protein
MSRDEAWATNGARIWHYLAGAWVVAAVPGDLPGPSIASIAVGSDGAVWAATDQGVAVLQAGKWRAVSSLPASRIVVDAKGTAWVGWYSSLDVTALSPDSSVAPRTVSCPTSASSLAVATDGAVYMSHASWSDMGYGGLFRISGATCARSAPLGDTYPYSSVTALATGPGGMIAAVLVDGHGPFDVSTVVFDGGGWWVVSQQTKVEWPDTRDLAFDGEGRLWRTRLGPDMAIYLERLGSTGSWLPVGSGPLFPDLMQLSIAPDGTLWFSGGGTAAIWRLAGVAAPR